MSWDAVIFEECEPGKSLVHALDRLFVSQRQKWSLFQQGEASLSLLRRKKVSVDGHHVIVQANPGRRRSTLAKTDAESVAARNCFLCPQNMPAEEQGIGYGDYVILPNPYPVLGRHCTIPHREHRPQEISGQVGVLLELARGFGPEMVVFYNGPRCGASAPDHLHFQACEAVELPILNEWPVNSVGERMVGRERSGCRYLVIESGGAVACQQAVERVLDYLGQISSDDHEPMLNMIVQSQQQGYRVAVFPRELHRPACYFQEGLDRIAISPAALEMAGILVVSEPEHFDHVDREVIRQVYSEVCLDPERFSHLAECMQ